MEDKIAVETIVARIRKSPFFLLPSSLTTDTLNPVLVRETRRIVRNNLLLAILSAYLFAMFLLAFFIIRANPVSSPAAHSEIGKEAFQYIAAVLYVSSTLFAVLFTVSGAVRDSLEDDMMFHTTLSPGEIVRGKLVSAAAVTLLFHSVSLPFLMLAYLLRGVDPVALLLLLPSMFFVTQGFVAVAFSCVVGVRTLAEALASIAAFLMLLPCLLPAFYILPALNEFSVLFAFGFFAVSLIFGTSTLAAGTAVATHLLRTRRDLTIATRLYFILLTYFLLGSVFCGCFGISIPFFT